MAVLVRRRYVQRVAAACGETTSRDLINALVGELVVQLQLNRWSVQVKWSD